ncbi:cytochrome c3 family protein [Thermosulfurimonas dismutans]|uniref:cytochrome c3 family protein n=1 Tax=Thermosulfurimonas dismutans TaxID=999894 RepID=UPI0008397605|nr:cytochrome c3 family protein [Thermosulfurimonas dismutans]
MRKWLAMLGAVGLILGVYGVGTGSCNKGPEVIKLPSPKMKKTTVTFSHHKHQEILNGNCGECHHSKTADWKQVPYKEGMKIEKCETCHNKSHPNKKLNSVKKAMHANCKGCHKSMKKAGKKHGPVKCTGCHKK